MKKSLKTFLSIALILLCSLSLCACFKKDDKNAYMIVDGLDITEIVITDNRNTKKSNVSIKDTEKITEIIDRIKHIKGTEVPLKLSGTFPNQSYVEDFPIPIYILTMKVKIGENSYSRFKIYGGQQVPVYYEASYRVKDYTYDYTYIAKNDNKTGCYENKKDGPEKEFYSKHFILPVI